MAEVRTLPGVFVDLCNWISAELHCYHYISECSYAVRRVVSYAVCRVVPVLAKTVG